MENPNDMIVAEKENTTAAAADVTELEKKDDDAVTVGPTLESLPVEIRTDIFSRVDSKTLARLRCVSKPLSSFISTPELISAHRIRSRKNPLLLYLVQIHEPYSYCLVSFDTVSTSSSHTGIILDNFACHHVSTCLELICFYDQLNKTISVCNPTNKYMLSLPPLLSLRRTKSVGFGYVPSTDKFKVVCVSCESSFTSDLEPCTIEVTQVFDVGTDKNWRYIEQDSPTSLSYGSPATVDHSLFYLSDKDFVVIKFDLEKEEWSMLPPLPFAPKSTCSPMELGGNLCLVDINNEKKNMEIWMLKDVDTYSWAKEYDIDLSSCLVETDNFIYALPLAMEEDGKLLISMVMDEPEPEGWWVPKLMRYDPRKKHGEYINLDGKLLLGINYSVIKPLMFYVDSLLSLEDMCSDANHNV